MEQIYLNLIILAILFFVVIWMRSNGPKFENFNFENTNNFAPIPYMRLPLLNFYNYNIPTGYDSGTRSYDNPVFANQVAQGLDTN